MSPQGLATQECGTALCLSVYVITFVLGFPANVLAFYTFCSKMQEAVNNMLWELPYPLCPLSGFIFYMTIYNSTFFLTAVSVERYLGVAFPIQHSLKRRPLYAVAASVFFWIFSFTHLSIVFIMPFIGTEDEPVHTATELNATAPPSEVCYDNFSEAQLEVLLPVRLELCLVLFCIPFLICSFCYINFIRILSRLQHIDRRRRLRAIGMALGTLLVFAVCFGPYNVSHVVGFITWKNPQWRDKALLCSTFNACLDPLIFYFSSSAVRGTVGGVTGVLKARLSACLSCRTPKRSGEDGESKQEQINGI
ncbi:free fatty acid receptor 2 isoform X2 [Stigmatopora argus]